MRFIRKNGRVIPIHSEGAGKKAARAIGGGLKDGLITFGNTTVLNQVLLKQPLNKAASSGLKWGVASAGVSAAFRGGMAIKRSLSKRPAQ